MSPQDKQLEATQIMLQIAKEPTTGNPSTIRLSDTEREWLGKLAKKYRIKMSDVWHQLLQQAICDEIMDGEVLALIDE